MAARARLLPYGATDVPTMAVLPQRKVSPECSSLIQQRHDVSVSRIESSRIRSCATQAVAQAPPFFTTPEALQLEVRFEAPPANYVPPTRIETSGRIVASALQDLLCIWPRIYICVPIAPAMLNASESRQPKQQCFVVRAVGDIHGDINKAMRCLELADVAAFPNGIPIWTGGNTIVVQLGDILDRGDAEISTLMLLRQLGKQAEEQGGAVHILNGNHESLNVAGDFRYAYIALLCCICACASPTSCNQAARASQAMILWLIGMSRKGRFWSQQ